jgi:hypothetical protein
VAGFDKVFVMLEDKLHFSVGKCPLPNEVDDTLRYWDLCMM